MQLIHDIVEHGKFFKNELRISSLDLDYFLTFKHMYHKGIK